MQFDLPASMDILRRTPATLSAQLQGLDDGWVRSTAGPETFSTFHVVGQLIDVADTA